jgi:predicted dinucleotide-binding enzyme
MTIGIIGSGAIGTAFARTLSRAGIKATISNSRGPESLKDLVRELGPSIKAGTREEAARADIVVVAVNWTKLPKAMAGLPDWKGALSLMPTIRSRHRCSSRQTSAAACRAQCLLI